MLTKKELNKHNFPVSEAIDEALDILLLRLNIVEAESGIKFVCISGLRSYANQMAINPKATKSKHLYGQAADIHDPNFELQTWCYDNFERLEAIGLWCEAFKFTPTWVHFQILPPRSGTRFFIP